MKCHWHCAEQQVSSSNVAKILCLPRRMILMIDPCHIWTVIYNAGSNRCHPPTSPNIVPATKKDRPKYGRNLLKTAEASFTMGGRSEHDPTMIRAWTRQSGTRPATEVIFRAYQADFVWQNKTFFRSVYHSNVHLRLPRKVSWTSPNIAPATKSDCHYVSSSYMKRYLQWAEQQKSSSNITKYCACREKWLSWWILVTHETSCTISGATEVILQHHQILRLPRKVTVMMNPRHTWNIIYEKWPSKIREKFAENSWSVIYNVRPIREWSESNRRVKQ